MAQAVMRMLPDGRVRIHWFMRCPDGPIKTPGAVHPTPYGPLPLGHAQGRIACQPALDSVLPQWRNGEAWLCTHTDDPRAATCPQCKATPEYVQAMKQIEEATKEGEPCPQG